jgi:ABC-2 type transport system permease protein
MKVLFRQVEVELKLFWRNRISVFFTALLPILMMVVFGYLNQDAKIDNIPYAAFFLPGAITMQVMGSAFENLSVTLTRQREDGVLKRLGGTPLRKWVFLGSKMLTASLVIFVQTLLLIAIGALFFEVKIVGSPLLFFLVLLTGIVTFTSMGFALSGLINSTDTQSAAAHTIQWPMLFICGSFFPIDLLPGLLQHVARVLPLTYFVDPLRAVLIEEQGLGESSVDLLVLLIWMTCCFIVSFKTFRWND